MIMFKKHCKALKKHLNLSEIYTIKHTQFSIFLRRAPRAKLYIATLRENFAIFLYFCPPPPLAHPKKLIDCP